MIKQTTEKIKARVGMTSLVGILTDEFPVPFGNYFDFSSGERCLNMWAENLEEFAEKYEILELECVVFSNGKYRMAFVTDKRVPENWLHDKLCVTGRGWGSRELCEACHEFQGTSTVNRVCGCEKPEEEPSISQFGRMGEPYNIINICSRCKREWKRNERSRGF